MNTQSMKATISAAAVVIVAFLGAFGIEAEAEPIANVLHAAAFLIAVGWGIWKNHNFTDAAQEAQEYLTCLKRMDADRRDEEDIEIEGE